VTVLDGEDILNKKPGRKPVAEDDFDVSKMRYFNVSIPHFFFLLMSF
jgi:hypothetical protein